MGDSLTGTLASPGAEVSTLVDPDRRIRFAKNGIKALQYKDNPQSACQLPQCVPPDGAAGGRTGVTGTYAERWHG
jgi:hypothetical protein